MGRPPLVPNEPSVSVSVRLPLSEYDRIFKYATAEHLTIAEAMRTAVQEFRPEK